MALSGGTRLGPYEILSPLGVGGMGEVYRARDGTLQRDVALKILPESVAADPERLARFRREAQVLAALNHPHIGAIYGFEESTSVHALVLELVEGPTLADRIAEGAIPIEEALPIAKQIAEALEAAHEQGIVHRDLKPANIKLRPDGTVKVLDFGLAKLTGPNTRPGSPSVSLSPTITSPAIMTGIGVLLGTAAYMSPEQAKGREADKRSDVWAFGAVLYEMLTGQRAFDGDDMADVLGAVVRLEPKWQALPTDVPPSLALLVRRCLVKEHRKRIGDIAAVRFVLDHETTSSTVQSAQRVPGSLWRVLTLVAAAVTIAAAAGGVGWFLNRTPSAMIVRTVLTSSGTTTLVLQGADVNVAITPDGSKVVYHGSNQLLIRPLDTIEPSVLIGVGAPRGPFIAADGQWIGYFDGQDLKKVAITGGSPVTVTHLSGPSAGAPRGGTWAADGTIVFATNSRQVGLQRVSADGGEPLMLTQPNPARGEENHAWPEFLPGGRAVLYTITSTSGAPEKSQIAVLNLDTGVSTTLMPGGSHPHYLSTGHLVYGVGSTLRAVRFDLKRRKVVGVPMTVLDGVKAAEASGSSDAAVAANGTLVYVPAGADVRQIVAVNRKGESVPVPGLPIGRFTDVRVSPDGSRVALTLRGDIWIYDLARLSFTQLTNDVALDKSPLWSRDGERLIFTSRRRGYPELMSRSADASGSDQPLLAKDKTLVDLRANGWSPDGQRLIIVEVTSSGSVVSEIGLPPSSDVRVLVRADTPTSISRNGRWIAYQSNFQIIAAPYPDLGRQQQISAGVRPIWSTDGHELFFSSQNGRQLFVSAVPSDPNLPPGPPTPLFDFPMLAPTTGNLSYDVLPDGRFIMIRSSPEGDTGNPAETNSMFLVQNWFEELKRLVPVP